MISFLLTEYRLLSPHYIRHVLILVVPDLLYVSHQLSASVSSVTHHCQFLYDMLHHQLLSSHPEILLVLNATVSLMLEVASQTPIFILACVQD